ncbi:MAG: hypothetical protein QOE36_2907 [Gaiellaceae bacterium]|nr:hypothetical protein [Gaiellaceae bacterium]
MLPALRGRSRALLAAVEASGLRGRGGAGFPTAAKLRAVAAGRRAVVVANGTEGEPASAKDKTLLRRNPHLVLDGVLVALEAVGGDEAVLALSRADRAGRQAIATALRERRRETRAIRVAAAPDRFVAGEESALVQWLDGGEAKPTFKPPRPFERGLGGRPTLVQNVETLANLGLIARYGPDWFRELGTDDEPGSALVTVRGAVRRPGVAEVPIGASLRSVVELCGGLTAAPQAVLVGGYFGSWLSEHDFDVRLSDAGLRPYGAGLGAGTIVVLPASVCGVAETARVASYLARESAGQCGPCVFGLASVAAALNTIDRREPLAAAALERLPRLGSQISGRGACAHPDGALRFVSSALEVFAHEVEHHLAGRCTALTDAPVLPVPPSQGEWR